MGTEKIMSRQEPMPRNGVQIFAWGRTKSYVQTRAQEPGTGTKVTMYVPEHYCLGTGHKIKTRAHREQVPTSAPEYKVGMDTVPEFWHGYLIKGCIHSGAKQESYLGTTLGNQV